MDRLGRQVWVLKSTFQTGDAGVLLRLYPGHSNLKGVVTVRLSQGGNVRGIIKVTRYPGGALVGNF